MSVPPAILWFRHDLRLADQPALRAALEHGPVVPVFIWSPEEEGEAAPGAASRWWLHQSLTALDASLRALGSRLIIRRGPTLDTLRQLARETGARAVFWCRRYEPALTKRDEQIKTALTGDGLKAVSFNGALLNEPWTIKTKSGGPFQVFTPFWKACLAAGEPSAPLPAPESVPAPQTWPKSDALESLELEPKIDWSTGLRDAWQPGEAGAAAALERFAAQSFASYNTGRNRPDQPGTSRLSPHLHFGEISPRQVWAALNGSTGQSSQFFTEIGWREFAHHLLFHFPHTTQEPLRENFAAFPWREDAAWLRAWQTGQTGYPIVDAGMRELWTTGWMHNRVRMIAGSFLVKDLLLDWRAGAKWFWDTLVDADLASNTLGWQWIAGCGADAAPYFRIFNPVAQGEAHDPDGEYVRKWVPEVAKLPAGWIHKPFDAPHHVLHAARVELGVNYPEPLVNHRIAREVALDAYARVKR